MNEDLTHSLFGLIYISRSKYTGVNRFFSWVTANERTIFRKYIKQITREVAWRCVSMAINCCILFNLPMLTPNSSVQSLTLKNVRSCYVLRSSFKLQNQLKNLNWTYVTRCFSLKGSFDIFISKVFISEMPLIPSINYACFTVKSCPKAILSYFEKSAQKIV